METTNKPSSANQVVRFKTNIKCGACVATVTPFLNEAVGEGHWQVDLKSPERTLTVNTDDTAGVKQAIEKAGYKAESLN